MADGRTKADVGNADTWGSPAGERRGVARHDGNLNAIDGLDGRTGTDPIEGRRKIGVGPDLSWFTAMLLCAAC
jgi:hypothetical protein